MKIKIWIIGIGLVLTWQNVFVIAGFLLVLTRGRSKSTISKIWFHLKPFRWCNDILVSRRSSWKQYCLQRDFLSWSSTSFWAAQTHHEIESMTDAIWRIESKRDTNYFLSLVECSFHSLIALRRMGLPIIRRDYKAKETRQVDFIFSIAWGAAGDLG